MADGLKDRMRLRHALNLAMEVQQNLLPSQKPKVRGIDMAARSQYCDETGGDYYDYLDVEEMGKNTLFVALGDVMGHGIAAAMLMATARGVLRSHVQQRGSLGDLLTHVNRLLVADTGGTRFMTMFLGVVDVSSMSLRWASAGHDQPLIYDPATGTSTEIDGRRRSAAGRHGLGDVRGTGSHRAARRPGHAGRNRRPVGIAGTPRASCSARSGSSRRWPPWRICPPPRSRRASINASRSSAGGCSAMT